MNPLIGAGLIQTGTDLFGSLLGYGAKKEAQKKFDFSIADLEKMVGRPIFNIGKIESANRAALFPRVNELTRSVSRQHNLDQPRVKQYLLDKIFNMEAEQRPALIQREAELRSGRDERLRRAIAAFRASQLG